MDFYPKETTEDWPNMLALIQSTFHLFSFDCKNPFIPLVANKKEKISCTESKQQQQKQTKEFQKKINLQDIQTKEKERYLLISQSTIGSFSSFISSVKCNWSRRIKHAESEPKALIPDFLITLTFHSTLHLTSRHIRERKITCR